MTELKCPFCGEKIEHIEDGWCNCKNRCIGSGSISLWQELIRTRKALDKAKLILKNLLPYLNGYERLDVEKAIKEITALEQKEHFANASKKVEQKD